jgi:hypothetical protein
MAPLDVSSIDLGDMYSLEGNTIIPIINEDPMHWIPEEPMRVIWNPKGFDDPEANRVTVGFEPTQEAENFIKGLNQVLIKRLE